MRVLSKEPASYESRKRRILVVGHTPPPVHGQSVMIAHLLEGDYLHAELSLLRMELSCHSAEIGRFRVMKLWRLFILVLHTYFEVFRLRPEVLYYPPAGSGRIGICRDIIYLWAVRWLFSKTVFHFHAAGFAEGLQALPRPLRQLGIRAYDKPDIIVRVADAAPDPGPVLHARKSYVVPNGVADSFPDGSPKGEPDTSPQILFLGRVMEEKGVELLLEATRRLREEGIKLRLALAGPAESVAYAQKISAKVQSLGLSSCVSVLGEVKNEQKITLWLESALFCLPSHYREELLPVSIIEGMAAGLPVIATRWRGIPELVEDGVTGILVEPRDIEGLVKALRTLLLDARKCRAMGDAGRLRYLSNHTLNAHHKAMDEVFAVL